MERLKQIAATQFDKGYTYALECGYIEEGFDNLKQEILGYTTKNRGSSVLDASNHTNWTSPVGDRVLQWDIKDLRDEAYPALSEFVGQFGGATSFRLNLMGPGSGLSAHKETICLLKDGVPFVKARFHLPITSPAHSFVYVHNNGYHFLEGTVYYFNNGAVHWAMNRSEEDRIHLVWDVPVTKQIYKEYLEESPIQSPISRVAMPKSYPEDGDYGVTYQMLDKLDFYG